MMTEEEREERIKEVGDEVISQFKKKMEEFKLTPFWKDFTAVRNTHNLLAQDPEELLHCNRCFKRWDYSDYHKRNIKLCWKCYRDYWQQNLPMLEYVKLGIQNERM